MSNPADYARVGEVEEDSMVERRNNPTSFLPVLLVALTVLGTIDTVMYATGWSSATGAAVDLLKWTATQ